MTKCIFHYRCFGNVKMEPRCACGMAPWLSWGVASGQKWKFWEGPQEAPFSSMSGMHIFLFGKRVLELHMQAFGPWRFMKYIQLPSFSYKQTTLNKPTCWMPSSSSNLGLGTTVEFVVENSKKEILTKVKWARDRILKDKSGDSYVLVVQSTNYRMVQGILMHIY